MKGRSYRMFKTVLVRCLLSVSPTHYSDISYQTQLFTGGKLNSIIPIFKKFPGGHPWITPWGSSLRCASSVSRAYQYPDVWVPQ